MHLDPAISQALNSQVNLELASAYAYFGMAAYFEHEGLSGFAAWMRLQGQEELGHANKFFGYLLDRGGKVSLGSIAAPAMTFENTLAAFEASLAHEHKVSAAICQIYEQAQASKDFATLAFLKWFLDEQVEEERTVSDMIAKLRLIGTSAAGLFQLDREAARRAEGPKG